MSVENDLWLSLLFENPVSESQNAWEAANDGNEALDFNRVMVILEDRVRSGVLDVVEGSYTRSHKPEREQQIFSTEIY